MQFAWAMHHVSIKAAVPAPRVRSAGSRPPFARRVGSRKTRASARGLEAILHALVGSSCSPGSRGVRLDRRRAPPTWSRRGPAIAAVLSPSRGPTPAEWLHLAGRGPGRPTRQGNQPRAGRAEYFAAFVESLFEVNRAAAETLARHLGLDRITGLVSVLDIGCGFRLVGLTLPHTRRTFRVRAVDWPACSRGPWVAGKAGRLLPPDHAAGDSSRPIS